MALAFDLPKLDVPELLDVYRVLIVHQSGQWSLRRLERGEEGSR